MSDSSSIAMAKREMRVIMRAELGTMSDADRMAASILACDRIFDMPEFRSAATVMLYLPLPGELDCTRLIECALQAGKMVCVPHVNWKSRAMQPIRLMSLASESLIVDRHGLRIPKLIEYTLSDAIDAVIVPGLAFDENGHRLGRGGGFYDRFLAQLPASFPTIGLAFGRQIVSRIPRETHDAAVRLIATETRLIRCG